ncbi:DMSO/TMAO reductase YedYZ molybdopterin-dependent catalytic subunit [Paenibacillus phyllosphaerae]|uniref:DMSO/TMAO reductase YedYZ molybdopterin-dependent catalytic subunit n=1 Tax=Paenibacillus phyllosphaerae TaxID=274593 RepID=A0A7W5B3F3_9BACL|nr:sulfite oxidase-like oxidoreductase [Paenibacillus phyllosphaerae]MBB3113522.1 DMSO/TMAO reductase YedYZ molybdopterin-dependent catalytic subunit [Paenibacillus phyllosphaerae]
MHNKADRLKKSKTPQIAIADDLKHRLPPGQMLTDRFPILHEGEVPVYDLSQWELRVFGEVEETRTFSMDELQAMPMTTISCDIHCVTRWSKFDTKWEGIRFRDFYNLLKVKPDAKYVMLHADNDYETNVPLEDLMHDDVLLAFRYDDKPLTDKHGFPLRLLVPHLYFWKSAKWLRGIEFMREDRPGFWERNGFHNYADPFEEQRFSGEDLPIPEDEWVRKEFD